MKHAALLVKKNLFRDEWWTRLLWPFHNTITLTHRLIIFHRCLTCSRRIQSDHYMRIRPFISQQYDILYIQTDRAIYEFILRKLIESFPSRYDDLRKLSRLYQTRQITYSSIYIQIKQNSRRYHHDCDRWTMANLVVDDLYQWNRTLTRQSTNFLHSCPELRVTYTIKCTKHISLVCRSHRRYYMHESLRVYDYKKEI